MAKARPDLSEAGASKTGCNAGHETLGLPAFGKLANKSKLLEAPRPPPDQLLKLAKRIHSLRRDRAEYFEPEIFSDPGWDILLLLYVAKREQSPMTAVTVCVESGVPTSTAVRWLRSLAGLGLVSEGDGPDDARYVGLTAEGMRRMEGFLTDAWMTLNPSR